jgi:hypothetical protein
MNQTANPLRKYFRQPVIFLRLPSGGKFYPPGTIQMPENGEIPIYPMTAVDEITTRTPDALFNGSTIMEIIRSCVPNILDPWAVHSGDLNALLAAVRLASYGSEMEISTSCPTCNHVHQVSIDLRIVLDQQQMPNYEQPLVAGDLTIHCSPMTYRQINEVGKVQYEDQKIINMINQVDLSEEEKMAKLGEAFKRITALTIRSIASSIGAIRTADAMVTDQEQIHEFLVNSPKIVFDSIKEHIVKLRTASEIKPIKMTCEEFSHAYEQTFTLDVTNFFVTAS